MILTSRSRELLVFAKSALIGLTAVAIVSLVPLHVLAQKPKANTRRMVTLNGVTLKIPKAYRVTGTQSRANSALMFGKEHDAVFFAVFQGPVTTDPSEIIKSALTQLYPKESQQYSWKELPSPDRISKFELAARAEYGYNGNQLVKVVFRNITLNEKVLLVGDVFEVSRGNVARTMFEDKLEAISLSLCNVIVESIFPLTREKADPKNPPCAFVADVETTVKPPPN